MSVADARERAVAFIERCGDSFAIACARALGAGRAPGALPLPDRTQQRADGSIGAEERAIGSGDLATLARVLGAAADLRSLHLPVIERACAYLETVQHEDGSWAEAADSEVLRLVRTGMLAGHLGKTRFARAPALAAAGDYIAAHFTPDLLQGFNWPAIAAVANFFANVPHDAGDEVLQWAGRELERGFRAGRFDGVQTARVLLYAEAPSLPGGRVDAAEALERLIAEQQGDGGWLRFDEPSISARLEHSLDALTALVRLG